MRDGDAGEVGVPPAVGGAFVVNEPEALLELAIVVLDAPMQLRQADQRHDRCLG